MPGETKIFKNSSGWYDVDNPSVYYPTRALCRDARRGTSVATLPKRVMSVPSSVATSQPQNGSLLTGLQLRLLDRLTYQQGVDLADAMSVILVNGYNKAASYGHMRDAGANHSEALAVINLDSPAVSVAYGRARANGLDHTSALKEALDDDDD